MGEGGRGWGRGGGEGIVNSYNGVGGGGGGGCRLQTRAMVVLL